MLYLRMTYSLDLRERAVAYVRDGGAPTEASRIFGIDRKTIYNWLSRTELAPAPSGPRRGKIDKAALAQHVKDYPDAILRERAAHFGVHTNAIWSMLKTLGITKKNDPV